MTYELQNVDCRETIIPCRDGFAMPALSMTPKALGPCPGLLFIGEPFGLNDEMRRVAMTVSAAGYVVLVPDLVTRGPWLRCVRALMQSLKAGKGQGVDDLLDARDALAAMPGVVANRIAVMGLCMGGGFALVLATTGLFSVAAPFYGAVPERLDGTCPVVASYGGRDRVFRSGSQHLQSELERLGVSHDVKVYPKAGHSFMTRPANRVMAFVGPLSPGRAGYEPDAAADAMQRVLAFLGAHV